MRLRRVSLRNGGATSVALWHDDDWQPLLPALDAYREIGAVAPDLEAAGTDLLACLAGGPELWRRAVAVLDAVAARGIDLSASVDAAPLLPFEPLSFRDFMLYERHAIAAARGMARRFHPRMARLFAAYERLTGRTHRRYRPRALWYERPIYYTGNHLSIVPDGVTIAWPSYTRAVDYELELGVVIAREIYNATPEEALAAIGGFTILNDFSARDVQLAEMMSGFGPTKAKNFATGMGSIVVSADEILPHIERLQARVCVNGREWGGGTTAGLQHGLGAMVAYASLGERLRPGELLGTGTIPGCSGMEIGRWLRPDDEIELSIDRIGTLRHTIGDRA